MNMAEVLSIPSRIIWWYRQWHSVMESVDFQFHQGLSLRLYIHAFLEVLLSIPSRIITLKEKALEQLKLLIDFQFHQGLSWWRRLLGRCLCWLLSIPSRIIKTNITDHGLVYRALSIPSRIIKIPQFSFTIPKAIAFNSIKDYLN